MRKQEHNQWFVRPRRNEETPTRRDGSASAKSGSTYDTRIPEEDCAHVLRHFRALTLDAQDDVIRGRTRTKALSRKEI